MTENYSKQPSPDGIVFAPHPKDKRFRDITNETFNHLLVLGFAGKLHGGSRNGSMWWVKCECGTVKTVASGNLISGGVKSCGCKKFYYNSIAHKSHGMSKSREFVTWSGMRSRCGNPNDPFFSHYGGRGIKVCDRWIDSFENFFTDMGNRPPGKTLDRIDVNGDYEPNNCKWSTSKEQCRNTRFNRILTMNGVSKCLKAWSEEVGLFDHTIAARLARGYSDEEALTMKLKERIRKPFQTASTDQHA